MMISVFLLLGLFAIHCTCASLQEVVLSANLSEESFEEQMKYPMLGNSSMHPDSFCALRCAAGIECSAFRSSVELFNVMS